MIKQIITFVAGLAIGAAASYIYLDQKYTQNELENAEAMDEILERRIKQAEEKRKKEETVSEKAEKKETDRKDYESKLVKHGYIQKDEVETKVEKNKKPYTIKPEEFGEGDQQEVFWVFWADGFMSEEQSDTVIPDEDIEKYIGMRSLGKFGEYEDDAVYVRNEYLGFDVFIRRDDREFTNVVGPIE